MRTTFIVRNLPQEMLSAIDTMPPRDAHDKLTRWAFGDLRHCVTVKYGSSGAFRDRVTWNGLMKACAPLTMKAEPRRGYRLFTFET